MKDVLDALRSFLIGLGVLGLIAWAIYAFIFVIMAACNYTYMSPMWLTVLALIPWGFLVFCLIALFGEYVKDH